MGDILLSTSVADASRKHEEDPASVFHKTIEGLDENEMIEVLSKEMHKAAKKLEFERAASIRDRIEELRLNMPVIEEGA